jgi:hypothetical protein
MQPLVSSLSAGDCLVHRLRKSSFLTGAQDNLPGRERRYQRLHIYNYAVDLLKMSRAMLETYKGF